MSALSRGGRPGGLIGPSGLQAAWGLVGVVMGTVGGCSETLVGPRLPIQAAAPILGPGDTPFCTTGLLFPRTRLLGLETLCPRRQSRKHLCFCLWFLYPHPHTKPCVPGPWALAFPCPPQVPPGPLLWLDPHSGHSRAGVLKLLAACSRPPPPPPGSRVLCPGLWPRGSSSRPL